MDKNKRKGKNEKRKEWYNNNNNNNNNKLYRCSESGTWNVSSYQKLLGPLEW
jgi:hypothetical protein